MVLLGYDCLLHHQLQQRHLLPAQLLPLAASLRLQQLQALHNGHQMTVVFLQLLSILLQFGRLEGEIVAGFGLRGH